MKKLLLFLLTLSVVVMLGACQQDTTEYATLDELHQLEEDLALLQERFDNLIVVKGLNGQVEYYENNNTEELNKSLMTLSDGIIFLKDTLDKTTAPSYILDDVDEYVRFSTLALQLRNKYFPTATTSPESVATQLFEVGQQAHIRYVMDYDSSNEDIIARLILLVEELRHYEFYLLSCPELYIHLFVSNEGQTRQIKLTIPLVTLINGFITITPDGIYDGDYEMRLESQYYNKALVQQYYDEFITNETFTGYVLNYE